ncbi:hypothetical protein M8J76_015472 [Diaphorina citri]|nr:hypothetical protein M8J76_015472 [Diaphorina citri]
MKKSKVPESPTTIYNNMSHHYRRLFGAKAVVDTSSPGHLKTRPLQSHHRAASTQSLNKLSLCDSNRPGSYKFHSPSRKQLSSSTLSLYSKSFTECPRLQKAHQMTRRKGDILDSVIPSSEVPPFQPRILPSSAESKLRQLQGVYFPPRKKPISTAPQWDTMQVEIESEDNIKPWLRSNTSSEDKKLLPSHLACDKPLDMGSHCSTSSKDSAYNEGEGNTSNDDGSRGSSPGCTNQPTNSNARCKNQPTNSSARSSKSWTVQKAKRRNEDALYVKFLRDITDDVLSKGVYTNKGLKIVFQKHINDNLNRLNLNRMKEEVEKLSDKIGIPKNEEDDKMDFGLGSIYNMQQWSKQDQQLYGTTPYVRPPTLSNIRQVSKSLTSSSSLDLEKELEALESYSDVELNEAEILDTLTMLNMNPRLLDNDASSNSTKSKPVMTRLEQIEEPRTNTNLVQRKTSSLSTNPSTSIAELNSNKPSIENTSHNSVINKNDGEEGKNDSHEIDTRKSQDIKQASEHIEEIDTENKTESIHETNDTSDNDSALDGNSAKTLDLHVNKLNEINATLFKDKGSSEKHETKEEIGEELEENNYSEDDFEQHSDSGEEIEEDFNQDNASSDDNEESVYSRDGNNERI